MTTCTFSALGERWTVWVIAPTVNDHMRGSAKLSPSALGLYFRAADGEERFLTMPLEEAITLGDLAALSNQELAAFAKRAMTRPVPGSA